MAKKKAKNLPSAAKLAAEKRRTANEFLSEAPAGAKAQHSFCGVCGTTEVVPFREAMDETCYGKKERNRYAVSFSN
jgi:hypothetical protein